MTRLPGMFGLAAAAKKKPLSPAAAVTTPVLISAVPAAPAAPAAKSPAASQASNLPLMGLLRQQQNLYRQLAELAAKQSECVRKGATETLMSILSARAHIIDQLEPLDKKIQPYRSNWDATLAGMSEADRGGAQSLMAEVQRLLASILKQDEEDRKLLEEQKEEVGTQITKTVTGSQLHKAYGSRVQAPRGGFQG